MLPHPKAPPTAVVTRSHLCQVKQRYPRNDFRTEMTPVLTPVTAAAAERPIRAAIDRFPHAHRAKRLRENPICDAATRYLTIVSLPPLPNGVCDHLSQCDSPKAADVGSLPSNGTSHTDDDQNVLFVRKTTPPPA